MKRKVKIITGSRVSQIKEAINGWIKEQGFELLDVKVICNIDARYSLVQYTATVIYADRSEV